MTNTFEQDLKEVRDLMATNITDNGVSVVDSDGPRTLAGKISEIKDNYVSSLELNLIVEEKNKYTVNDSISLLCYVSDKQGNIIRNKNVKFYNTINNELLFSENSDDMGIVDTYFIIDKAINYNIKCVALNDSNEEVESNTFSFTAENYISSSLSDSAVYVDMKVPIITVVYDKLTGLPNKNAKVYVYEDGLKLDNSLGVVDDKGNVVCSYAPTASGTHTVTVSVDDIISGNSLIFTVNNPNYYVSSSGSDSNAGTSIDKPFLTLNKALNTSTSGSCIRVLSGTYSGTSNVRLNISKNLIIYAGAEDTVIFDGASNYMSGFYINSNSYNVIVSNITYQNGVNSGYNSGALMLQSNSKIVFCTFKSNKGSNGGAVYNSSSNTVEGCTFSGNTATNYGGAVYNSSSNNTVEGCTFSGNTATNSGGAVYNSSSNTVEGCTFSENSANYGGAVWNSSSNTVEGCTFSENSANYGGAVWNSSSNTVEGCTFSGNTATNSGGAVYNSSSNTVEGCTFSGNTATNYGGAVYNSSSNNTVEGCTFSGNTATNSGGAVYNSSSNTVEGCTFSENSANYGGAVWNSSSNTVEGCTFSGNTATNSGGAVYNSSSANDIQNNSFINNLIKDTTTIDNISTKDTNTNTLLNNWWGTNNGAVGVGTYDNTTKPYTVTLIRNTNTVKCVITNNSKFQQRPVTYTVDKGSITETSTTGKTIKFSDPTAIITAIIDNETITSNNKQTAELNLQTNDLNNPINKSITLKAKLNTKDNKPITNEIISFYVDNELINTSTTNNLGIATLTYTPTIAGVKKVKATLENSTNYFNIISDIKELNVNVLFWDNCLENNSSTNFSSNISLRNSGVISVSYDSTDKSYILTQTVSSADALIPIKSLTNHLPNFTLDYWVYIPYPNGVNGSTAPVLYNSSSQYYAPYLYPNGTLYKAQNEGGTYTEPTLSLPYLGNKWLHITIKFESTQYTYTLTDSYDDVLTTFTTTMSSINNTSNSYGLYCGWNGNTSNKVKKIRAVLN